MFRPSGCPSPLSSKPARASPSLHWRSRTRTGGTAEASDSGVSPRVQASSEVVRICRAWPGSDAGGSDSPHPASHRNDTTHAETNRMRRPRRRLSFLFMAVRPRSRSELVATDDLTQVARAHRAPGPDRDGILDELDR